MADFRFTSAPNPGCTMKGVFVISLNHELITYAQSDGWSSVMYSILKSRRHRVRMGEIITL